MRLQSINNISIVRVRVELANFSALCQKPWPSLPNGPGFASDSADGSFFITKCSV